MRIKYYFAGAVLIFIYMLPYIILGEDAYITIHDFLDQDVAIIADLKNNGILASISGTVPNMEGLDRTLFQSFTPFDIKMVCSYLLPPYWAIICYTYLYKLLAFVGMFLLVDTYIMNRQHRWMAVWVSILLALVPFYVLHGISGVGLPMLIYAFLNLYHSKRLLLSYFLITVYVFNSMLAYGGFFALAILFSLLCWDYYKNRIMRKHIIYGAALMCLVYVVANWGTIHSLFFSQSFVSHRTEWAYPTSYTNDMIDFLSLVLISNYHAGLMLAAPILILFLYLLWRYHTKYSYLNAIALLYFMVLIGVIGGTLIKHLYIHLFVEIQFNRFYFFYPALMIIMLSSCCAVFLSENKKKLAGFLLLFGLLSVVVFDSEFRNNVVTRIVSIERISPKLDKLLHKERPSFRNFYDEDLFSVIHKDLGTIRNYKTKVVSVGLYPSVAEFNGFYTLDSYQVNYPMWYKHQFRKVIEKELDKSDVLKSSYDNWGSRCYLFSAELGNNFLYSKADNKRIDNLDINIEELKKLGCEFILSAVKISNYSNLNLDYIGDFSNDKSYWRIWVYRLK